MFKCEVTSARYYHKIQETQVIYKVSDKGNSKTVNHKLTGKPGNCSFLIGEIDRSIKKGDLIRCDGLPYMVKPRNALKYERDSNGNRFLVSIEKNVPVGYKPFQLDSGYWVLRRK